MTPQTEQELLDATIDLARLQNWACTHFRAAQTRRGWRTAIQGNPGFADLVLARRGVVLIRELKGPRGRLSSEQRDWARQIDPGWRERDAAKLHLRAYQLFDVWRAPHDWPLIVATLTAKIGANV